ncbi:MULTISPECIES: glycosyltransferase family 2 protein [unclassified Roseburia]|uniref:glycosyltransferase family 2 protein n=1 Tax=unclassified Roseburia TaxID=2637578 RepID=UPI001FA91C4F|nr:MULTISPECIES: glycosyltransferase family 2 protein [unclassified Roseburia]
MAERDFVAECIRLHVQDKKQLIIRGFFPEDNPEKRTLKVYVNQKEMPISIVCTEGPEVRRRYLHYRMNVGQEITASLQLPEEAVTDFKVCSCLGTEETEVFHANRKQFEKLVHHLDSNLEMERFEENQFILTGWSAAGEETACKVIVDGTEVSTKVHWKYRKDVVDVIPELSSDAKCGFEIYVPDKGGSKLTLELSADGRESTYVAALDKIRHGENGQDTANIFQKTLRYWKNYGLKNTIKKVCQKLSGQRDYGNYEDFLKKYGVKEEELARQRQEVFENGPCFSIAVPLYQTKEKYLREMIESVQAQTYTNWELCLADGSGREHSLQPVVGEYIAKDKRIKYCLLDSNEGIAGNTNEALKMADGDFVVLTDHDDLLSPEALYQCAKAVQKEPQTDVIYSDEDKVDMSGKKFFEPHFKSDYNIDLLCTMNYICHLFVVRKDVMERAGLFESCYDGAQDHDFILRCTEKAEHIVHIPKVLYHWRCHAQSTSENPESKLYAFENGCKAVKAHYDRIGIPAEVEQGPFYGMYRTHYLWKEQPLVSILIPNKDHAADLKKCMDSIEEKSTYRNFEFIIVENNSTEEETFSYYKEIEKRDNVRVLYYKEDFNYSRINNFGAKEANGEYVLLLNNDTEMIEPDSIKEMLDVCMRLDVGIVGAKLLYEDNTIQHAGVIIGFGGVAGHAFIGQDRDDNGYFSRIISVQDLSAVTAACLMVRRSVFDEVEGLNEEFKVAFNDIDFCLKVRKAGYLVVYNPYAQFYHYESKSRGQEDSADKVARFQQEIGLFGERWGELLEHGDPYYNPNLTLDKADFSLKE